MTSLLFKLVKGETTINIQQILKLYTTNNLLRGNSKKIHACIILIIRLGIFFISQLKYGTNFQINYYSCPNA